MRCDGRREVGGVNSGLIAGQMTAGTTDQQGAADDSAEDSRLLIALASAGAVASAGACAGWHDPSIDTTTKMMEVIATLFI
jgi:hypothetical protein